MSIRPRRSVLYMPGSNARALEKAKTLPADGVILDLEDSVAPEAKETARQQVADAVKAGGFGAREVFIRVNSVDTSWHSDDLAAAAHAAPDAILVPKVSSADTLELIGRRLLDMAADHKTRVWAMIETPLAIFNILSIAQAASDSETRLSGFVMGTNDHVRVWCPGGRRCCRGSPCAWRPHASMASTFSTASTTKSEMLMVLPKNVPRAWSSVLTARR
jgi:citrate lyase subunit beta/citryl-CoA lyase